MANLLRTWLWILAAGSLAYGAPGVRVVSAADDFSSLDLSGDWYVLIHYKDDQSADKTLTKFKDFGWTIKQTEKRIDWEHFPYVFFGESVEEIRRHAMTEHLPWEPDEYTLGKLEKQINVSARAAKKKKLKGTREDGFKSKPASSGGGLRTLTFSEDWEVAFSKTHVRIQIVDSLSGGGGLAGMDEATLYVIRESVGERELRGTWREGTKHGSFRMLRSAERKVGQ